MKYIQKLDNTGVARGDRWESLTYRVELEFLVSSINLEASNPDPDIKDQKLFRSTSSKPLSTEA